MIRVLFTIPNFLTAGSGHALYQMASRLDQGKFEVHIMAKHDGGDLVNIIKNSHIKFHSFNYESPSRPIRKLLLSCRQVSREFREIKPQIIYSYHYSADYSEAIAAKMAGIPWIYVKKNMSWYGPSRNAWWVRSLLAKKIVVQNSDMEREFLYRFRKKLIKISIGVDTETFKPPADKASIRKRLGADQGKFIFIHVSSLLPIKGVDVLLEAYEKFCLYPHADHELWIVGPDDTNHVFELKKRYESNHKIKFWGSSKNVLQFLQASDSFIQPTLTKGEGSPIALQEAMAVGLICIGSKTAGIKDQMEGFDDLIFAASNSDELCSKLKYVYELELKVRMELNQSLRQRAIQMYSLKNEVEQVEKTLIGLSVN